MSQEYFTLDINGIIGEIIAIAKRDKRITNDEQQLINRIKDDLKEYEKVLNHYSRKKRLNKQNVLELQEKLRIVLVHAIETADVDQIITDDEQAIIIYLAEIIEEEIQKQMQVLERLLAEEEKKT